MQGWPVPRLEKPPKLKPHLTMTTPGGCCLRPAPRWGEGRVQLGHPQREPRGAPPPDPAQLRRERQLEVPLLGHLPPEQEEN